MKRHLKHSQCRKFGGADEGPIVADAGGSTVNFVKHLTYLGSVLDQMLSDLPDVGARISKALAAFGALRHSLFGSRHIFTATRVKVFQILIMSKVLRGCESWSVTALMASRLRSFQAQCVRQILGVSMKKTISRHITTTSYSADWGCKTPCVMCVSDSCSTWER